MSDPQPRTGATVPQHSGEPKRTLTPANFVETVANVLTSVPVLVPAFVSPKTSAALREKIFLGVTSVNDCRYCKWLHTHWSMAHGVPLEEVNRILGLQVESLEAENPAEAAAILFGRRYAEHRDQVDAESMENLRRHFSDAQVDEILASVRFITFANLFGNTADAFLDRLFVGVVGAAAAPLALLMLLMARFDRRVGIDEPSPWRRRHQETLADPDTGLPERPRRRRQGLATRPRRSSGRPRREAGSRQEGNRR